MRLRRVEGCRRDGRVGRCQDAKAVEEAGDLFGAAQVIWDGAAGVQPFGWRRSRLVKVVEGFAENVRGAGRCFGLDEQFSGGVGVLVYLVAFVHV